MERCLVSWQDHDLKFTLCSLLSFQWAPPIAAITIQNSAAKQTTVASRSGLCATVSTTAGTTVMSRTVVGGAAGEGGGNLLGGEDGFPM